MQKKTEDKRTRPFRKEDWTCPTHKAVIKERHRKVEDKRGEIKYGGTYYACPEYPRACGHYASPFSSSPTCSTAEDT